MSYASALSNLISGSGKTLRDIADSCKIQGVNFDPSYLSRLQTGKQAPPSDAINRAIAKVLGEDPTDLLLAAYKEKAPGFIKALIDSIVKYHRRFLRVILVAKYPKTLAEEKLASLENMDDWQFIYNVINDPEFSSESIIDLCGQNSGRPAFSFTVPDSSLNGVPRGTEVIISKIKGIDDLNQGDYVLIVLPDRTHHLRKFMLHDDKIILLADNLSFKSYTLSESIEVIGRVDSIRLPLPE